MTINNPIYNQLSKNSSDKLIQTKLGFFQAQFQKAEFNNGMQLNITLTSDDEICIKYAGKSYHIIREDIFVENHVEEGGIYYTYQLELKHTVQSHDTIIIFAYVTSNNDVLIDLDIDANDYNFISGRVLSLMSHLIKDPSPHPGNELSLKYNTDLLDKSEQNSRFIGTILASAIQQDLVNDIIFLINNNIFSLRSFPIEKLGARYFNILEWLVEFNSKKSFHHLIMQLGNTAPVFMFMYSPLMRVCLPGYDHFYAIFGKFDINYRYEIIAQTHIILQEELKKGIENTQQRKTMQLRLEYLQVLFEFERAMQSNSQLSEIRDKQLEELANLDIPVDVRNEMYENDDYLQSRLTYLKTLTVFVESIEIEGSIYLKEATEFAGVLFANLESSSCEERIRTLEEKIKRLQAIIDRKVQKPSGSNAHSPVLYNQLAEYKENLPTGISCDDNVVSFAVNSNVSVKCNGKPYNIISQELVINETSTESKTHYNFILTMVQEKLPADERVLIIYFDANDHPTVDEDFSDEETRIVCGIAAALVPKVIKILREGKDKQHIEFQDESTLNMLKNDIHLEFLYRTHEFYELKRFKLPGYSYEYNLLEWALFFGSIRIFKAAINQGSSILKCDLSSPFRFLIMPGYEEFLAVVQSNRLCKSIFSEWVKEIRGMISNSLASSEPNSAESIYNTNIRKLMDNFRSIDDLLLKNPDFRKVADYLNQQTVLNSRVKINKEIRVLSNSNLEYIQRLSAYYNALYNLLIFLNPEQIIDIFTQILHGIPVHYQNDLLSSTAMLESVYVMERRSEELLFHTQLMELIYKLGSDGRYQGMKEGEIIYDTTLWVKGNYHQGYQNLCGLRFSLAKEQFDRIEKLMKRKTEQLRFLNQDYNSNNGESIKHIQRMGTLTRSMSALNLASPKTFFSPTTSEARARRQNDNIINSSDLLRKAQAFENSDIAATDTVPFTVRIIDGNNEIIKSFHLPIAIAAEQNLRQRKYKIFNHFLSIYENPQSSDKSVVYTIEYDLAPSKCFQVYFNDNFNELTVEPSKLASFDGNILRELANRIVEEVYNLIDSDYVPNFTLNL